MGSCLVRRSRVGVCFGDNAGSLQREEGDFGVFGLQGRSKYQMSMQTIEAAKLASFRLLGGCNVYLDGAECRESMSLENLIEMQSSGAMSIDEPNMPRPGGLPQSTVLVVLDVTIETSTAAVYWALGNVVRRGDNLNIVGIVTHLCNPSTPQTHFRSFVYHSGYIIVGELLTVADL